VDKTIVVAGYGPGISDAVARRFGREGYAVALVARTKDKLDDAVESLGKEGVRAHAFPTDLGDPGAVRALVRRVSEKVGPLSVLHWNAFVRQAGDLVSAPDELRTVLDIGVHGLLAAVQEALPDLKQQQGAVLVTGGGYAFYEPAVDAAAVQGGAMGLAVSKAAQHKLVGLLNAKLAPDGVYVGEVTVTGLVKGTEFDKGDATIEPSAVADAFWELLARRSGVWVTLR